MVRVGEGGSVVSFLEETAGRGGAAVSPSTEGGRRERQANLREFEASLQHTKCPLTGVSQEV